MQLMSHGPRVAEYVMVHQGILLLKNDEEEFVLQSGDAVYLNANEGYFLASGGNQKVDFTCILTVE